jgi:hypothetical protein
MSRVTLRLLFHERHVDGVRNGDEQESVAVRRRAHCRLQGQTATSARPVVDDDRLTEPL